MKTISIPLPYTIVPSPPYQATNLAITNSHFPLVLIQFFQVFPYQKPDFLALQLRALPSGEEMPAIGHERRELVPGDFATIKGISMVISMVIYLSKLDMEISWWLIHDQDVDAILKDRSVHEVWSLRRTHTCMYVCMYVCNAM